MQALLKLLLEHPEAFIESEIPCCLRGVLILAQPKLQPLSRLDLSTGGTQVPSPVQRPLRGSTTTRMQLGQQSLGLSRSAEAF